MKVVLRRATKDDYELMLKWRNDPDLMKGFYSQKFGHIIKRDEHLAWLKSRNKDFHIYIIHAGENGNTLKKVGVIIVSQMDYWEPETAGYIGDKCFVRKGISTAATRQIHDMLREKGYKYTRVTILDDNQASINMFLKLGFKRIGEGRPGESIYRLTL